MCLCEQFESLSSLKQYLNEESESLCWRLDILLSYYFCKFKFWIHVFVALQCVLHCADSAGISFIRIFCEMSKFIADKLA